MSGDFSKLRELVREALEDGKPISTLEHLLSQEGGNLAEEQVEQAERLGCKILSPLDEGYPVLLAATNDFPLILWVKGRLPAISERSVAIIGPREPTRHGEIIATRMSTYFVSEGWSVVSGLAKGCDAAAHRAALAAGGHTVAVLAHGLQTISPKEHKELAAQIVDQGGALVSEFPIGWPPQGGQFVQRDRTQAGLSQGVVMVQSGLNGGSLHAPRAALKYGRWVAVPEPTKLDTFQRSEKIQANLLLTGNDVLRKVKLMQSKLIE